MNQSNTVEMILNARFVSREWLECQIWKNTFESILEKNLSVVNIVLKDLAIVVNVEDIYDNATISNKYQFISSVTVLLVLNYDYAHIFCEDSLLMLSTLG